MEDREISNKEKLKIIKLNGLNFQFIVQITLIKHQN